MNEFTESDLQQVLKMGRYGVPAFKFCATKEMAAALSNALEEKLLEPTTNSFVLTEKGKERIK